MSQGTNFPDLHRSSMQELPTRKHPSSDEDEPIFPKPMVWHRVKWTEKMIRLLITAVSYIGDDDVGIRNCAMLQKKGKWKSVCKAMFDRGFQVSPQQCEDKFNDLNKRYKKLNDMLGRGTSCEVVENPALLNVIEFLTEKEKDEVRKVLSSKHLFYEEMCSYHNGNRLHLPDDPDLQKSLKNQHFDDDGDCQFEENRKSQDEGTEYRVVRLEERKLQYRLEVLELKRQRLKWEMICRRRDEELEKMKMENQRMKVENAQIALELKQKEMRVRDVIRV